MKKNIEVEKIFSTKEIEIFPYAGKIIPVRKREYLPYKFYCIKDAIEFISSMRHDSDVWGYSIAEYCYGDKGEFLSCSGHTMYFPDMGETAHDYAYEVLSWGE